MSDDFRVVARRPIAEAAFVRLEALDVITPTGNLVERVAVRHPGAVAVVAVTEDDVVLIRQYRAAVDRSLLEIPAGKLDVAGEAPAVTAARELEEEVGFRAGKVERIGEFFTTPGFCDELMYLYFATDLRPVPMAPTGVEEMAAEVVPVRLAAVPDLLVDGSVHDAKTLIGLNWLARNL